MHAGNKDVNPKFAHTLSGTIADERRHVGFGENRIGSLIKQHPEKKPEIEQLQKGMSYHMLATFAGAFRRPSSAMQQARAAARKAAEAQGKVVGKAEFQGANLSELEPQEIETLLADTVLKEFKVRLGRIGIEYQTPERP
jgi:hypothetical protein